MTVLVVGAGPVGLTAAISLAQFGAVRIIDSRAAPTQLSKALVIWRRSLHTLDPIISCESWMPPGKQVMGINLADSGNIFAAVNFDPLRPPTAQGDAATATATPPRQHMLHPGLFITQAQIETGLEQHLQDKFIIKVQRSTALHSFSVDEEGGGVCCALVPTATDDPADSTTPSTKPTPSRAEREEILVSHLIGCDGARSAVRKGLGVPFPGYSDPDNRFLMMDCT
jgi:2-polyprenyl-6-methoxyphenol hydroxylase-like FAD-dependent oxidoreductase